MTTNKPVDFLVTSVSSEAVGIKSFELVPADGTRPPPFSAGAHVDLHLANGMVRSYSLINPQSDSPDRYVIAVNRDGASRGGSAFVHDHLMVGHVVPISGPRNNFALVEDAQHIVFIAGGIGITPLWCMIQRLEELGRSWELFYSTRTREVMAFRARLEMLENASRGRVHLNFDHEPGGRLIDIASIVAKAPADAHFYCCGPGPMLQAFEKAVAALPPQRAHVEYFTQKEESATEGGFTVVLARTGRSLPVSSGKTILETLLAADLDVQHSCMEGMCGTCEVRVIEGIPDHRDSVLTPDERSSNKTMMICCSGSKTSRLVLDL
jgi:tetrachlorobenzoquinone reductase